MADPWDITGTNPDIWRNLMTFGNATMAAANKPGATTLGALGAGGLAVTDLARQNAQQRADIQARQADAYKRMMEGRLAQYRGDIVSGLMAPGQATAPMGPSTMPSSTARPTTAGPQETSGAGQTWVPALGSSNPATNPRVNAYPRSQPRTAAFMPPDLQLEGADKIGPEAVEAAMPATIGQQVRNAEAPEPTPDQYKLPIRQGKQLSSTEAAQRQASLLSAAGLPVPEYINKAANLPTDIQKEVGLRNAQEFSQHISEIGDRAAAAPGANAALDNIKIAAQTADPNAFAPLQMKARQYLQGVGALFGDVPQDKILNSMMDLSKNEGIVLREVLKSTYTSRISNMDNALTAPTLPNLSTPKTAMPVIISQLQGANDYNMALNKLAQTYQGDMNKNAFIKSANDVISPMAFMAYRYPRDVRQEIFANIAKMDGGPAYLQKLDRQIKYARNNGLLPD